MNQALKQRLVGAVVLIALAVIFLPAFFNGGRPRDGNSVVKVPPAPDVTPFEFEDAQPPASTDVDGKMPPLSEWYSGEQGKVSPDDKVVASSWVLQVASFTENAKAETLKKNLQSKGYRAFVRTVTRDRTRVSRVLIGPEMDEAVLKRIKPAVDRDFRVTSIVTKFEP